ncbi:ABC transporter substrate-binding protein [Mycoplasma sp. P36-A1]|uniref:ABC transporter substrate-binding protein n=1 Tax=Mycoplasma sp. P36-A1 TaxID=3252900 RepID=UPI003C30C251
MKKLVKVLSMIALVFSLSFLSGCSSSSDTSRYGDDVEKPEKLDRIISTSPSNTEILAGLGLADKIVGSDSYSIDSVEGLPKDIKTLDFMNPDIETLIALKPDVVIGAEINTVDGKSPLDELKDKGIKVLYIPTAKTYKEITKDIEFLGDYTSTTDKATEVVKSMNETYDKVSNIAKTIPEDKVKSVYVEVSGEPSIFTTGKDTFINDLISSVGAKNIFAENEGWFSPSVEQIITAQPDVILTTESYDTAAVSKILKRSDFKGLDAVKNKQVFAVDYNASSRASQNAAKALEEFAKTIYPEYYE